MLKSWQKWVIIPNITHLLFKKQFTPNLNDIETIEKIQDKVVRKKT